MITIRQAETSADINDARHLFREYETWLDMDRCFQGFEAEVAGLPGKYAGPEGRLDLAYVGTELAGCIALRPLEPGICEMKRLYVRAEYRGLGIGKILIEGLLAAAHDLGYRHMRLDTYPPKMGKAVDLYRRYGFVEIPPYYHNPYDGVLFMECAISPP